MKMYLKILFVSLVLGSQAVSAQYMSIPYRMSTPGGSFTVNNHVYMPMNYGGRPSNPKYTFEVRLKNDSLLTFKSRILAKDKKLYIEQKKKGPNRLIYPAETERLVRLSNSGNVIGVPADSCWLFLVKIGAIKCYSSDPATGIDNFIAIQKGNEGRIMALNKRNLMDMLDTQDEKIFRWIQKDHLIKAVKRYNELAIGRTQ